MLDLSSVETPATPQASHAAAYIKASATELRCTLAISPSDVMAPDQKAARRTVQQGATPEVRNGAFFQDLWPIPQIANFALIHAGKVSVWVEVAQSEIRIRKP